MFLFKLLQEMFTSDPFKINKHCFMLLLMFDCDMFFFFSQEEDKARLVQETGLQLKQINNWFINQRKRNWHSNPSTSTVLKSKRKRYSC